MLRNLGLILAAMILTTSCKDKKTESQASETLPSPTAFLENNQATPGPEGSSPQPTSSPTDVQNNAEEASGNSQATYENSKDTVGELNGPVSEPGALAKYISLCEPETRAYLDQCTALKSLRFQNYTAPLNFDDKTTTSAIKNYDKTNALIMVLVSGISYFSRTSGAVETELRNLIGGFGFERIDFVDNASMGFEAIIASNSSNILISFRGTDGVTDILSDSELPRKSFEWGKIHAGFAKLVDSNWDLMAKVVKVHGFDFSKPFSEQPSKKKIWITGHSLGAALAVTLGAKLTVEEAKLNGVELSSDITPGCNKLIKSECELKCEQNANKFESGLAKVYAFALPPVGDKEFARCINANINTRQYRFTHYSDPVVSTNISIPTHLGFVHPKTPIYFDKDGSLKAGADAEANEGSLSYKIKLKNINDHRIKNYISDVLKLSEFACPPIVNMPTAF